MPVILARGYFARRLSTKGPAIRVEYTSKSRYFRTGVGKQKGPPTPTPDPPAIADLSAIPRPAFEARSDGFRALFYSALMQAGTART